MIVYVYKFMYNISMKNLDTWTEMPQKKTIGQKAFNIYIQYTYYVLTLYAYILCIYLKIYVGTYI